MGGHVEFDASWHPGLWGVDDGGLDFDTGVLENVVGVLEVVP